MFDAIKKAQALEAIAKQAGEVFNKFTSLDENHNGIPDGVEILNHLKALPELIQKEGSEVLEEAEDARKKIADAMRAIAALAGEDIEAIQAKAGKEIADIQKRIEALQK
jgi:ElaB/YqjD/DUF883 family membrane-anchored ribosome-binding protein